MKVIKALLLASLMSFSVSSMAKYIQIKVNSKQQMVRDLRTIQYASSDDTVVLRVSHDRQFSKAVICRYVDALKDTKARVKFREIPRHVIRHARDC